MSNLPHGICNIIEVSQTPEYEKMRLAIYEAMTEDFGEDQHTCLHMAVHYVSCLALYDAGRFAEIHSPLLQKIEDEVMEFVRNLARKGMN